ncbi:MAG: cupredoxin domain-containing protein [Candidatus Sungiibacteriota bacterium]
MCKKIIIIGVIVITIAAGGWMLARDNDSSSDQPSGYLDASAPLPSARNEMPTPPANQQTSQPPIPLAAAAVKEFIITGKNFSFTPSTLTVKKGDTVKITLKNIGGTHDLRIDGFNATTQRIGTGEQDTVTFIADKTGSFEFYCSIGSHRRIGMKGTLTVME